MKLYQKYTKGQLDTVEIDDDGITARVKTGGKSYTHKFGSADATEDYLKKLKTLGFRKVGK